MSIIMLGSEYRMVDEAALHGTPVDPAIRDLLDHVAAELANEYIRLMERAAEAEPDGRPRR